MPHRVREGNMLWWGCLGQVSLGWQSLGKLAVSESTLCEDTCRFRVEKHALQVKGGKHAWGRSG